MTIEMTKEGELYYIKVYHVRVRAKGRKTARTYLSFLTEQKANDCAKRLEAEEKGATAWVMSELIFA